VNLKVHFIRKGNFYNVMEVTDNAKPIQFERKFSFYGLHLSLIKRPNDSEFQINIARLTIGFSWAKQ